MSQTKPWDVRIKRAAADPVGSCRRVTRRVYLKIRHPGLKVVCYVTVRWGSYFGASGNYLGRLYWKLNKTDIVPLKKLYEFFSQERPDGNFYPHAIPWSSRSQSVINVLGPIIEKKDRLLELGCNCGRNLNHLWQAGYHNLRGVEISRHAVQRLRSFYPQLSNIPVDVGPAEVILRDYRDEEFDVVLTMAVLEEIHPESRDLFAQIARVTRKYVLAIEPRKGKASHFQFPWNIKQEFLSVGLSLVEARPWRAVWPGELTIANEWDESLDAYDAFLFSTASRPDPLKLA